MANFIRLTVSADSTEVPRWRLVQALDVLCLARHCGRQRGAQEDPTEQNISFERLAKAFNLDAGLLKEEFNTCLHAAKNSYERDGDRCEHRRLDSCHQSAAPKVQTPIAVFPSRESPAHRPVLDRALNVQGGANVWPD